MSYDPDKMELNLEKPRGGFSSAFSEIEFYFHGFQLETVTLNGRSHKVEEKDFAFIGKLTEFDPLPEQEHPYHEIKNLKTLKIKNEKEEIKISGLF